MNIGKIEIEICMGSSCYSRGNATVLDVLEKYIEQNALSETVQLKGRLCLEECSCGPNITINGKGYSELNPDKVIKIVSKLIV